MSKNINNIDDLLRDSFEDFSSAPSPKIRAKLSAKLRYFNFFKFNPGTFNIFYLTAIILGTSATIIYSTSPSDNNSSKITIKSENLENNINTKEDTCTFLLDTEKSISQTNETSVDNSKSVIVKNDTGEDASISPENVSENEIFIHENEINDSGNSEPIEKSVIFDTIINAEKIVITDTIKTEVHKTVEVKKKKDKK
ncbi:MAG: hypothetical protein PHH30_04130 [Bacteroidales bacterium]|nr:hypothetical protein [Bacteroidales bacterium]MDD3860842.1 hypothetical protein [Bacteroidales bacterium]